LSGRLGTRVAAAAINLSDAPRYAATLPRAFDAEGVAKAPLPLIQDGVAHRVVHDIASAAAAGEGQKSTGHAVAPAGLASPAPRNLVLVGGGARDEDELASPIDAGVLVPRLVDVAIREAATARFAAHVPDGLVIRGGTITGRAEPFDVEGELLDVLSAVEALGAHPRLVSMAGAAASDGAWGVVAPAVRLRELIVR
jgi:predicted Zn-dependent protease